MHPDESSPVLIGQNGSLQGRRWPIPANGLTIGRGAECEIVVADRQVSRQHARLIRAGGKILVQDLDSKNGTTVNGNSVKDAQELRDGDVIQIALAAKLVFIATDSTLPLSFEGEAPAAGRIRLNPVDHSVYVREQLLDPPLSIHQYRLLELLVLRGGALITREDLVSAVWPGEELEGITDQAIDALVRRLRERLKELDPEREYLLTIRGHGFRLDNAA